MQSYTFLIAATVASASSHSKLPTCGCLAAELGFTIDCTKQTPMQDAYDALEKDCLKDCTSDACKKNWAIVETHHDFCLHDQVPKEVEVGFHDLEEVCAAICVIGRMKDPDHQACKAMECPDSAGVDKVIATLADNECDKKCPEDKCGNAFRELRIIHDTCQAKDDKAWEWAGIFKIADKKHTWSMQKVDGKYADQTMRLALIPTTTPTEATMEENENKGSNLLRDDKCKVVEAGEEMKPVAAGSCFELHVDDSKDDSTWPIDTDGLSGLIVYAQHVPIEFERDRHYFYDSKDVDIEPEAQESAEGHDHDHPRRLEDDVDAALHDYEEACDAVACYVEATGCSGGAPDLTKLDTLKDRASKKCHIKEDEAAACPTAVADASGVQPVTVLAGVALVLTVTMN